MGFSVGARPCVDVCSNRTSGPYLPAIHRILTPRGGGGHRDAGDRASGVACCMMLHPGQCTCRWGAALRPSVLS
jgi:hypothetical protein